MKIKGAWIHTPARHIDERGSFEEQFKKSLVEELLGTGFDVAQTNQSISAAGVIRGIHYTVGDQRQAKFVSCVRGAIWDVVVDIRPESNTYLSWDAVELTPENGRSVLISEDLGHLFLAISDGSIINYLCSSEYSEAKSRYLHAFDPKIGIDFESVKKKYGIKNFILSERDNCAPLIA